MQNEFGLGCQLNPPDERDFLASLYVPTVAVEPFDYRPGLGVHSNQGSQPRCVGHAHAKQSWYFERQQGTVNDLSPDDLYELCKLKDGNDEPGTYPRVAYTIQRDRGICETPFYRTARADENARTHRIESYAGTKHDPDSLVQMAIASKCPVAISIEVWQSLFDKARVGGVVPMPGGYGDVRRGYHRILFVAYVPQDANPYKLWNSWGDEYGDRGNLVYTKPVLDRSTMEAHTIIDAPNLATRPWGDFPNGYTDLNGSVHPPTSNGWFPEGNLVKTAKLMQGYPDDMFRPKNNVTQHQVITVARRAGISGVQDVDNWKTLATRGWVKATFPGLVWLEERWLDFLTRFELCLLLARWLVK